MITIACVLRSGGVYDAEWVGRLKRGVEQNITVPHRFVCLSDLPVPCERIELETDWPGWWSKIELFRPGLFDGPALYFDLDTVIIGSLDALAAYPHNFTMAHDFYRPEFLCSTAMAWRGDYSRIWEIMQKMTPDERTIYDKWKDKRIGDQAFIEDCLTGQNVDTFQDLFGKRTIASFKRDCRIALHGDEVAVAFHGHPKPNEVKTGWVADYWRGNQL